MNKEKTLNNHIVTPELIEMFKNVLKDIKSH